MTMTMFTRFVNIRNMMNVNNFSLFGNEPNGIQCSSILRKLYSTTNDNTISDNTKQSSKRISKAMKIYLQQAKEYNDFIQKEVAEYNIGKRHLANMMGEDINNFSEQDVNPHNAMLFEMLSDGCKQQKKLLGQPNKAIRYLFPSGLYDPEARPKLVPPDKLYASRKKAEFDETGRPWHFLFYTARPNYYGILHKIAKSMIELNQIEDERIARMNPATPEQKIHLEGSEWIKKHNLESKLLEQLTDTQYEYFLTSMQRLIDHPFSNHVSSFVKNYMVKIETGVTLNKIPKLEYDEKNRPYVVIQNCSRKSARGDVKVIGHGSGKITINGKDILYFENIQCREQVSSVY